MFRNTYTNVAEEILTLYQFIKLTTTRYFK